MLKVSIPLHTITSPLPLWIYINVCILHIKTHALIERFKSDRFNGRLILCNKLIQILMQLREEIPQSQGFS